MVTVWESKPGCPGTSRVFRVQPGPARLRLRVGSRRASPRGPDHAAAEGGGWAPGALSLCPSSSRHLLPTQLSQLDSRKVPEPLPREGGHSTTCLVFRVLFGLALRLSGPFHPTALSWEPWEVGLLTLGAQLFPPGLPPGASVHPSARPEGQRYLAPAAALGALLVPVFPASLPLPPRPLLAVRYVLWACPSEHSQGSRSALDMICWPL